MLFRAMSHDANLKTVVNNFEDIIIMIYSFIVFIYRTKLEEGKNQCEISTGTGRELLLGYHCHKNCIRALQTFSYLILPTSE